MKDVMIDFETWGTNANAAVVQVGACYFDRMTGEIGRTFKRNVCAKTAMASGATVDADTLYWWLKRDKEAIDSITLAPLEDIKTVFEDFNQFLSPAEKIWSHATFDFPILSQTLRRLKIKPFFKYHAAKDIRTLLDQAGVDTRNFKREGVHHDGLADSIFQVKYCVAAMKKLGGSGV